MTHESPSEILDHIDNRDLDELRRDFPGHRIWRATRSDGTLGEWVATLHDPAAGVDPTVMAESAGLLRAALLTEKDRAAVAARKREEAEAAADHPTGLVADSWSRAGQVPDDAAVREAGEL